MESFKTLMDNHLIKDPRNVFFGQGSYASTVAAFQGTVKSPMEAACGNVNAPTNRSFQEECCTIALWKDEGETPEGKSFYDLVGLGIC
ncbi:MAG TPA: hypothetical protein VKF15_06335 [Nitrososphaerales archaeon]|nr:hypothetical protein [Nitrososphaerales archaeon]